MTEPEVSLYIALYFIKNELTDKNVHVSIDGAHVKTKNTIHFEIEDFYLKNGFKKLDTECDKWQGEFAIEGYDAHIIVTSKSGIGDVVIETKDDSTIIRTLDLARDAEINTFMCTTHDRIANICDIMRAESKKYNGYKIYPCMPYAHKYANAVTDLGITGALKEYVPGNFLGSLFKGGVAFLSKDYLSIMELLIDAENVEKTDHERILKSFEKFFAYAEMHDTFIQFEKYSQHENLSDLFGRLKQYVDGFKN